MDNEIRPSPIAGQWYSSNPTKLGAELDGYISEAILPPLDGEIIGIVAPHAGYRYSGPVAGHAFAAIRHLRPDVIVVLSPMHSPYRENFLTTGHDYYWTPLGKIPVDKGAISEISRIMQERDKNQLHPVFNDPEHSLEIELPFLQRIYSHDFSIIPIMVRDMTLADCETLGRAIHLVLQNWKALAVISTDLSHFYPENEANRYDTHMLKMISNLSPEGVLNAEIAGDGFACGAGAVLAGLFYAKLAGAKKGVILKYGTSGVRTGDYSSVVGYGAIALIKPL